MCEECVGLEWEARALHKAVADGSSSWGVQPSGVDGCCSGETLPKVVGELWGCGCPAGELPMPAGSEGSAIPGTPRGSLSGEGAQLRSLEQTDSSAARVARGTGCLCSALLLQLFDFYRKCVQCDLSLQLPPGCLCWAGLWGFSFPHYTQQWESLGALPGFLPLFHPSG